MKWLYKSEFRDDRGAPREAIRIQEIRTGGEEAAHSRRLVAERLREAMRGEADRQWLPALFSIVLGGIVFSLLFAILEIVAPFNPVYKLLAFVFCVILCTQLSRRWAARRVSGRVAASIVAEGLCGCCGQSLRSMPVEEDGCVQCAECGAAWKWERVTRPYWEATPVFNDDVDFLYRLFSLLPRKRKLMTPDDRGRYIRAMDSWLILMRQSAKQRYTRDQIKRLRHATRRVGRVRRLWMVGVSVAIAAAMCASVWFASRDVQALQAISSLMGVVLLFTVPLTLLGHAGAYPEKVAHALSRLNVCGCCGSPLESVVESDGCRVCDGCGSAWKSPDGRPCGRCGYSLLGLDLAPGQELACPECGELATVAAAPKPSPLHPPTVREIPAANEPTPR